MSLGIFTTITNPAKRGDNYLEALACYKELADVVTVVDGERTWPKEFDWPLIGQHFQKGYNQTDTDWVIHADIDFIFHQNDFKKIKQALRDYPDSPAVSFYKYQFILPDRYNIKSRLILAVNKKKFGDRIRFNGAGDLCQPTLDNRDLDIAEMPQAGLPFYNYEKLSKTKEQIIDDVERMDRAYQRHFGKQLYSSDTRTAWDGWYQMVSGRFNKVATHIPLSSHPKYIQETIKNLTPDQWGYSGFGLIPGRVYDA